jgi:hypothetical protein
MVAGLLAISSLGRHNLGEVAVRRLKRRLGSMWRDQTGIGMSRLLALGGVSLVLISVVLSWLLMVLVPDYQALPQRLTEAFIASGVCAALASMAAVVPWRWLSVAILVVAFVGSFVMQFGWYLLLFLSSFPPFALIGLGELLYAAAALGMAGAYRGPSSHAGDLVR